MVEILPIKLLTDEDAPIYGTLNVSLGKLQRADFPVANGFVITPPNIKLKTTLEHFDFSSKELFQQSLTLLKKEIRSIAVPEILKTEAGKHKAFLLNGKLLKGVSSLWFSLLDLWLDQIKERIWREGFYQGITNDLDPQAVSFVKKPQALGIAYFDALQDDVNVNTKFGKLHPNDLKKIVEITQAANKKLFFSYEYEWVLDQGVQLTRVLPYTPVFNAPETSYPIASGSKALHHTMQGKAKSRSAVKIFADLSNGFTIEKNIDGAYIASEEIFDLNLPTKTFDQLAVRLVEAAVCFPGYPVFFKLADKSEGMGKLRGSLRLLHQKSLIEPLLEALDFARHKKGLNNIHIVIPFVRSVSELSQVKKVLANKKFVRKPSLEIWMEAAVPENIVNLEKYLLEGLDGVVFNLDELIAHLNGFDPFEENLAFYKNEVEGLMKFLEDAIKLLHKSKIPFIAYGSLVLYPKVLEFLVEKGVYGVVVEKYDAHSAKEFLYQTEKRLILRRTA